MPTVSEAQRRVDEARNRRTAAVRSPEAGGAGGPTPVAEAVMVQPTRAILEVNSPGSSPSLTGPECLSEAI